MKNRFGSAFFTLVAFIFLYPSPSSGQDKHSPVTVSGELGIVSRYLWRGLEIGQSPSLQPGLCVSWKEFTIGAWGAYKLTGPGMQETDFYLSKSFGFITLSCWDYWNFTDTAQMDFFDYRKPTTPHILEAQVFLSGGNKLPFNFLASYFFYGADPSKSAYLELQYVHHSGPADLVVFAGYQPKGTYYAPHAAFVNIGCALKRSIRVTDHFNLPVCLNLVFNPANQSAYLVAGLSFAFDGEDEDSGYGLAANKLPRNRISAN